MTMFSGCKETYRREVNDFLVVCPDCGWTTRVPNIPGKYPCIGMVWDSAKGTVPCQRAYYVGYLRYMEETYSRRLVN